MLVIENETWCIHAPAREQLVNHLLEFIWPQRTIIKNNFRDYVAAFVEARIRHFRDSVARHFREKAKQRAQKDHKTPTLREQHSSAAIPSFCPSPLTSSSDTLAKPDDSPRGAKLATMPYDAVSHKRSYIPEEPSVSWESSVIALPHTTHMSRNTPPVVS